MGTLEELAINSLNAHNSDEDRKILQKEFASRMAEIDSIACEINYNGIILLDGRWRQISGEGETVTRTCTETVTEYETVTEEYEETVTTYTEEEEEYTETVTTYEEYEETYEETVITYTYEDEEYPYTYTKTTEKPLESHAVRPSPATPTGIQSPSTVIMNIIPDNYTGDFNINSSGTWQIPEKYSGRISFSLT